MNCTQAVQKFGEFDVSCPKRCLVDEARDDLPQCAPGQKERSRASCNRDSCRNFLLSMDDATIEGMTSGFGTCDGAQAWYTVLASMGADSFKVLMKMASLECDQQDAFAATIKPADTCTGATWLVFLGPDSACPRQCAIGGGDLPRCEAGQSEYDPTSCGVSSCGVFIGKLDEETLGNISQGLAACATDPNENTRQYAQHAAGAGDGLRMRVERFAKECGHEDKINFSPMPKDSCLWAYGVIERFGSKCPKQCEGDGDNPRRCGNGEPEYNESTCVIAGCYDHLAEVKDHKDEMMSGMSKCAEVPNMEHYAQYASHIEAHARGVASACGFNYDDIKTVPAPHPSPAPGPRPHCITLSAHEYKSVLNNGFKPTQCH